MIRQMRYLGDPVLRKKCRPIETINSEVLRIAEELLDTVKAHNGSGLAAPQIGYDIRMFCVVIGDEINGHGEPNDVEPKIFINPIITYSSKDTRKMSEGCLSIPGFYEDVIRPKMIDIEARGIDGEIFTEKRLKNWRARCIQHEYDHIEGILFTDRLSDALKKEVEPQLILLQHQFRSAASKPFSI